MKSIFLILFIMPFLSFAESNQEFIVWSKSKIKTMALSKVKIKKQLKNYNAITVDLSEDQVKDLQTNGFIVEKNKRMHVLGKRSSSFLSLKSEKPWGVKAIHAQYAHMRKNGAGQGVTVCVVDTGIADDHPALSGKVVGGQAMVKSTISGKSEWYDDQGHGTHVSGTVAGDKKVLLGVAPRANLYAVKVLGKDGSGSYADVADGIKACIGHSQVINISLGGSDDSQIVHDAIKAAKDAGLQIACAAGNESGDVGYPAKYDECVAVSAIDSENKFASFSCFGPEVDFAAPGVGIKSSTPGGGYETWDGTSMATPHVSGVMAIKLSRNKSSLKGVKISKLNKDQQGSGRIDAYKTAR